MRHVLTFIETERYLRRLAGAGPGDRERTARLVDRWFDEHADRVLRRWRLSDSETATTIRTDGLEPAIADGTFGAGIVAGFAELEIVHVDEAVAMLRSWPGCPVVEIRRQPSS